ncbi:DUF2790 domain-containing protein [Zestomonas carbonaria]|uniref:DUF2790 domain-containing protein n=1 Tax=Zestomonas carbonaria TaxID=2762745 RepID=A0A7U7IAS3_9GAMM|nr:DUF2790 domain-containing protein [Pseudomonas carbonaria]CAD5109526.1 hypothetical protein PSEWESI4_03831 [Pseudomonas carbonaria]
MKSKSIMAAASLFAVLNLCTFAARAEIEEQTYTYATRLDVQKALSIREEPSDICKVVDARMTYEDSQGVTKAIRYLKLSQACDIGG